jgi:HlyD family secretion protein
MKLFTKKRVLLVVGVMSVGGATAAFVQAKRTPEIPPLKYQVAVVDTGDLNQTVNATGTINPVTLVNVGSQVSGTVVELLADFNDHVKKGQVLLKLDPTIFNAQISQNQASLAAARASMRLAQANFDRNERLARQNFISSVSLDQTRSELEVAKANVKLAEAQLARAEADLNNSVIRAPIDGVIIKRTIDLGQTVAASFTTPNLFQIARDLSKMQIDTSVSEADVAELKPGLPARFVVDAYPDKEFQATLRQFRLAANVVQNVVTYNVVLDLDNRDELLKPGMTAQVRLAVGRRDHVLRIPTAALRFHLSDEAQQALDKKLKKGKDSPAGAVAGASGDDLSLRSKDEVNRSFRIFKLDAQNAPQPVDVKIGLSNFRYTEVVAGPLKAGEKVITREAKTE